MQQSPTSKWVTLFYFLPRILAILFICFLAVFALDVIIPGESFWYIIGVFLIHLIPNYLLLVALVVAWKKEFSGGIVFLLLGFAFTLFFQTYLFLLTFLMISFPVFLIGILFLLHNYFLQHKNLAEK